MRRGFKAWCERTSIEYRQSFGLDGSPRFEPDRLANDLGVTLLQPEELPDIPQASLHQLLVEDPNSWSAVTVEANSHTITVINSTHSEVRQRSSLCHELSHIILNHKPGRVDLSKEGHILLHSYDKSQEEEANWLSGTLLVPRELLSREYFKNPSEAELADRFGVSHDLLTWRLRMTGVLAQARRRRRQ